MDRQAWSELLATKQRELGLADDDKFVYGPWDTLSGAEAAFLSLNPGKAPDKSDKRTVLDERGNSCEVERCTRAPTPAVTRAAQDGMSSLPRAAAAGLERHLGDSLALLAPTVCESSGRR